MAFADSEGLAKLPCLFFVLNYFYMAFQRHCCKMLPDSALSPTSIFHRLQERHTVRLLVQGNMGCRCISVCPVSMLGIWCSSCHSGRPFGCESVCACVRVCACVCAHACVQDRCSTWLVRSLLIRCVCVHACVRASGALWEWWFLLVAHSCERIHCCCAMFTFRGWCST